MGFYGVRDTYVSTEIIDSQLYDPNILDSNAKEFILAMDDRYERSRILFLDTEWGRDTRFGHPKHFLKQLALVDADGEVVLDFVSRIASPKRPFLYPKEEMQLRRSLATIIKNDTILVVWAMNHLDLTLLRRYCPTAPQAYDCISLVRAWKSFCKAVGHPGQTCRLEILHPKLCPESDWVGMNHSALPDAQMAREMGEVLIEKCGY